MREDSYWVNNYKYIKCYKKRSDKWTYPSWCVLEIKLERHCFGMWIFQKIWHLGTISPSSCSSSLSFFIIFFKFFFPIHLRMSLLSLVQTLIISPLSRLLQLHPLGGPLIHLPHLSMWLFSVLKYNLDLITPLLKLQKLFRIVLRIKSKIFNMTYKSLHKLARAIVKEKISRAQTGWEFREWVSVLFFLDVSW